VSASAPRTVAVFGAGIAGLTAAHELAQRGHRVRVYEAHSDAGGFFRSRRRIDLGDLPSEYSWHGLGPWYHNTFDLLRRIPHPDGATLYDRALSRPIDFGIAPDDGPAAFDDTRWVNVRGMFRMTYVDLVRWAWLMAKTWTAGLRSTEVYASRNAAESWRPLLSRRAHRAWRASFGPWIGSDWTNVSLHTAGHFFEKQLTSRPAHHHSGDSSGPPWRHGARDGWLLLRGPSSEWWFEPWVAHLETLGVEFEWSAELRSFHVEDQELCHAHLADGRVVDADAFVLAINPFAAADVVERAPELLLDPQLCLLRPLVHDGPHTQISLRMGFAEPIAWPRERTALVISESEFNLTLFAQEQAWAPEVDLGVGIRALWTITACVTSQPGRLYCLPALRLSKEQFIAEVRAQLLACDALAELLRRANGGRTLADFEVRTTEVWYEWKFTREGVRGAQPKWVNTIYNQPYQPTQRTSFPNFVLAGAHTRTEVDVWSVEAAVESGRRAAQVLEPDVAVLPQYVAPPIRILRRMDDACYAARLPHVLDVLLVTLAILAALAIS
jgi:hypothetical protein